MRERERERERERVDDLYQTGNGHHSIQWSPTLTTYNVQQKPSPIHSPVYQPT